MWTRVFEQYRNKLQIIARMEIVMRWFVYIE